MVVRLNDLIKTVYEDRLEKQEIDIARQQAELLALHSQINPHFLFNVLESIRMHSIIKREDETAGMIERLAILQRQNVDWSDDYIRIKDELKFVEAYLDLQKYRFGDKLNYQISVRNGCENYYMPKLTLETFVENACVHGAESNAGATWIYIRVYDRDDNLCMEVEDTGDGMTAEETSMLNRKMRECTIEDLKAEKHVGMINACLRLKMHTNSRASVAVESEKGVGTTILINIPKDTLKIDLFR
jgi:two-component system sensor histidine kinase YesM